MQQLQQRCPTQTSFSADATAATALLQQLHRYILITPHNTRPHTHTHTVKYVLSLNVGECLAHTHTSFSVLHTPANSERVSAMLIFFFNAYMYVAYVCVCMRRCLPHCTQACVSYVCTCVSYVCACVCAYLPSYVCVCVCFVGVRVHCVSARARARERERQRERESGFQRAM